MTPPRALIAAAATLALASALGACSAGSSPAADPHPSAATTHDAPSAAPGAVAHNEADAQFAQMMIVHHQGALEMADLAAQQGSTAEVRALAERIAAAQDPEIDVMTGWLATWGEDAGHGGMDHGGMDHGGMTMDGLDHDEAMAELSGLSGQDFDRRFLELMIAHHRGAIGMSEEQVAAGEDGRAVRLAEKISADQAAEIAEMEAMLAGM